MIKISSACLAFVLFFFVLLGLLPAHLTKVRADVINPEAIEARLIELINTERQGAGLRALAANPVLTQVARAKAADMLARGYFDHTTPDGRGFMTWVDSSGYQYSAVAENLALNLNMNSPETMVESWLNSPSHRENLLSNAYSELGMGVSAGIYREQPAIFAVHIFASPKAPTQQATYPKVEKRAEKTATPISITSTTQDQEVKPIVPPVKDSFIVKLMQLLRAFLA